MTIYTTSISSDDGTIYISNEIVSIPQDVGILAPTHTMEDGSMISDSVVILPSSIDANIVLYSNTMRGEFDALHDAMTKGKSFTVSTRSSVFKNMIIESIARDESAKDSGSIPLTISFVEVMQETPAFQALTESVVIESSDSDTVDAGERKTESVESSTAAKIFDSIFSDE